MVLQADHRPREDLAPTAQLHATQLCTFLSAVLPRHPHSMQAKLQLYHGYAMSVAACCTNGSAQTFGRSLYGNVIGARKSFLQNLNSFVERLALGGSSLHYRVDDMHLVPTFQADKAVNQSYWRASYGFVRVRTSSARLVSACTSLCSNSFLEALWTKFGRTGKREGQGQAQLLT